MEFKDIQRVNSKINTTNIRGKDYAEVHQRVMAFRELEPEGRIETQIVSIENGVIIMKASAYTKGGELLATGYAYEKENSTNVNKTSYIENCETSAIGRCLGFAGFGIDTSIASAEEVANAIEQQEYKQQQQKGTEKDNKVQNGTKEKEKPKEEKKQEEKEVKKLEDKTRDEVQRDLLKLCEVKGFDKNDIAQEFKINITSPKDDLIKVIEELRGR